MDSGPLPFLRCPRAGGSRSGRPGWTPLLTAIPVIMLVAQAPRLVPRVGAAVPGDRVLRDEAGRPVVLSDLLGRPTFLTLNYFRCAGICSSQLDGLTRVLGRMEARPGKDFTILTVSFDPRDTWEVAARRRADYLRRAARPIPPEGWRFMTGDGPATKALADAVGFSFQAAGEDFLHPAVLVALGSDGRVVDYLPGVDYDPERLEDLVRRMAAGLPPESPCVPPGPAAHRFSPLGCLAASLAGTGFIFMVSTGVMRFLRRHRNAGSLSKERRHP